MAWSEIGDVNVPATENGTYSHLDGNPVSITPPTMASGDLVIVTCVRHSNIANTWTVSNAGGQSWTSQTNRNPQRDCESRTFTCIYNGTWSANPTFQYSDTTSSGPVTVRMFVFRDSGGTPPSAAPEDGEDYAQETGTVHSGNTLTTLTDGALVVHWFAWEDDNTVTVNTPTGWNNGGGDVYYRNSYAPGGGATLHWQEQATAGTGATFTVTQAFLDDVGIHSLAFAPAAAGPSIPVLAYHHYQHNLG